MNLGECCISQISRKLSAWMHQQKLATKRQDVFSLITAHEDLEGRIQSKWSYSSRSNNHEALKKGF